jgi:hypothetical protein
LLRHIRGCVSRSRSIPSISSASVRINKCYALYNKTCMKHCTYRHGDCTRCTLALPVILTSIGPTTIGITNNELFQLSNIANAIAMVPIALRWVHLTRSPSPGPSGLGGGDRRAGAGAGPGSQHETQSLVRCAFPQPVGTF